MRVVRAAGGPPWGLSPFLCATTAGRSARHPHLLRELLAHQRQDQRRLPHLGCAGRRGQRGGQGRGAPLPQDRPGPAPAPRLPSPSPTPAWAPTLAQQQDADVPLHSSRPNSSRSTFPVLCPHCPPTSPALPAPLTRPHQRARRAREAGCAAVPPRGRTRHCWRCTGQGAGPRPRVLLSPSSFPSSFPLGQDQPTLGRMALLGPQFWTGYRRSGIWAEADFRPGRRARPRAGGAWRDQQTMRQCNTHVYFKCTGRNIEKHSCANKHFTHAWGLGNLHTESPESIQCEGTELSYPAILPSTRFSTNPACLSGEPLPRPV